MTSYFQDAGHDVRPLLAATYAASAGYPIHTECVWRQLMARCMRWDDP